MPGVELLTQVVVWVITMFAVHQHCVDSQSLTATAQRCLNRVEERKPKLGGAFR